MQLAGRPPVTRSEAGECFGTQLEGRNSTPSSPGAASTVLPGVGGRGTGDKRSWVLKGSEGLARSSAQPRGHRATLSPG